MGRDAAFGWVMTALYVAPHGRAETATHSLGSRYRVPTGTQLCAASTPEAKAVSHTGRAYDWARGAP
ncbi:hypothetical protein GCM10018980_63560 [Streptomyces capoamus]|uniref:Uncharacterized protein n=1 Tax=Streptomyces capoamus TaxID=68183 RepID=A0A919F1R2_9ACTN|nr:hypothetical protein GCM10018980_63560 [Streptomyces capoamus]